MLKPISEWTDKELQHAVDTAPHFRKWDTINMAVWLGCHAKDELERRAMSTQQNTPVLSGRASHSCRTSRTHPVLPCEATRFDK